MVTLERTKSQEVRSFFVDFFNFLIGFECGWLQSFLQRDNFRKTKPPKVDNLLQLICKTDRPERSTKGRETDGRTLALLALLTNKYNTYTTMTCRQQQQRPS